MVVSFVGQDPKLDIKEAEVFLKPPMKFVSLDVMSEM